MKTISKLIFFFLISTASYLNSGSSFSYYAHANYSNLQDQTQKDFFEVCEKGEAENAKKLLALGANLNSIETILMDILCKNPTSEFLSVVKFLVQAKDNYENQLNINYGDYYKCTALYLACCFEPLKHTTEETLIQNQILDCLFSRKEIDVFKKSIDKISPLMQAARHGYLYAIKLLLKHKANRDKTSKNLAYKYAKKKYKNAQTDKEKCIYKKIIRLLKPKETIFHEF